VIVNGAASNLALDTGVAGKVRPHILCVPMIYSFI
jgi:hypothetical protein